MADGRWLVADGKDLFIFCCCRAGQTGRLPLRKPCPTVREERDPRELSAMGYPPPGISHWPCLFVPLTGAACAVSLKAKSKDKIPWP
jgi:hypothetical protein